MKCIALCSLLILAGCATKQTDSDSIASLLASGSFVDLTYTFNEQTVYWPTAEGFEFEFGTAGETPGGFYYEAHSYRGAEHGGTHLDAPIHFFRDRQTVDQIPVANLIGAAVVVDVSTDVSDDPDYQIRPGDLLAWEEMNGRIPEGSILLFRTGFGQFWPDRASYLGTDERGSEAVAKLHFPGIHPEAAQWIVNNRKIAAVGIDTASLDRGQSTLFESHQVLFEQNIPGFENVANLEALPAAGSFVMALPMKIDKGSGAPLRIVAWIPDTN
ncbi:MAG: cyclase family protein [Rhodothermales bacterium]|nr:cyclase family protein [Rhodothermales bacterium]